MNILKKFLKQFGKPEGFFGLIAGKIMTYRGSNRMRNKKTIELLGIEPNHNVFEIGYGPGLALEFAAEKTIGGMVFGIDHSDVMFKEASKRNKQRIQKGQMLLRLGKIESLDSPEFANIKFDRVYSINSIQFWDKPLSVLTKIKTMMNPNAKILITFQARNPGATDTDTLTYAEKIKSLLVNSGFKNISMQNDFIKPACISYILATKED